MNQVIDHKTMRSIMVKEPRSVVPFDRNAVRTRFHKSDDLEEKRGGDVAWLRSKRNRQLHVLVADDCRDTADTLSTLMTLWGHKVSIAYDGAAALQMASNLQADILVLDIAMPKLSGYEVARRIRRQAQFDDTLLIAMTGWADHAHRLLGDEAGFDHYLIKPLDPSTLECLLAVEQDRRAHSAAALSEAPRALAFACNGG